MYHTVSGEDELPETPVLQLVKSRELSGYKQEGTIRLRLVVPSCAVVWLCAARFAVSMYGYHGCPETVFLE